MSKKRIAVYPFSEECMVFSEHNDLISDEYIFAEAASPEIWEESGRSIKTSEGEYVIKTSPSEFESKVDILLVPEFEIAKSAERGIVSKIIEFVPEVDEVIYYGKFTENNKQKIKDKCEKCRCAFSDRRDISAGIDFVTSEQEIVVPDVPVVAVAGAWENTGKFDVLLSLKRKFMNEGYKTAVIGSRGYSDIFGCFNYPDEVFASDVSERIKPVIMNRYLNQIISDSEPDIVIVGVPGSLQPLTEKYTNGFGITPFIAFQSFVADFMVLCSFFGEDDIEFYDETSKMCKYRYGIFPDVYHMSDMYIDVSESNEKGKAMSHTVYKERTVNALEKLKNKSSTPVIDLSSDENIDFVFNMIIDKLTGDTRVVV